ncbi:potassium channel family protein [Vibrio parahaemolyticus]
MRAIKSISMISHAINENKTSTSLHFMVVTSLMMMLFGSIYILYLEKDMPGTNIHNAGDALWWTFVTITTVGYGDFFPVTLEGRIVAIILITTDVGMFGSFTAVLASWTSNERKMEVQILEEVHDLRVEVHELKSILKLQAERNG